MKTSGHQSWGETETKVHIQNCQKKAQDRLHQCFKNTFVKRRFDELVGKKFYQRLVPGITWQVYNKDILSIDLAIQTGYRISPKLTSGVGFVYRIGVSDKFDSYVKSLQTYGPRIYSDLMIAKGIFVHGEFEAMYVNPGLSLNANEPTSKAMTGSYFGLGKRFKISRSLRGSILGLYRVEYTGELPDVNKVTARFGIEYNFRKPKIKIVVPRVPK